MGAGTGITAKTIGVMFCVVECKFTVPSAARLGLILLVCLGLFQTVFAQDIDALRHSINFGTSEEKRSALFVLRNLRSPDASDIAIAALKDADPIVRATAAASSVFAPRSEAIEALAPLLSDEQPFVRKEAAYALAKVGGAQITGPLLRSLEDESDVEVRSVIAMALGSSGSSEPIQSLVSILKEKPSENTESLRRSAARSIGQIASASNRRIVTPQSFLPEKYKEFPKTAPPAWRTEAVSVLIRVLANEKEAEDTRRESAFALGSIGDASSTKVLTQYSSSADPFLAEICREALVRVRDSSRSASSSARFIAKR